MRLRRTANERSMSFEIRSSSWPREKQDFASEKLVTAEHSLLSFPNSSSACFEILIFHQSVDQARRDVIQLKGTDFVGCYRLSLIKRVTKNFSSASAIGRGDSGRVFKGILWSNEVVSGR